MSGAELDLAGDHTTDSVEHRLERVQQSGVRVTSAAFLRLRYMPCPGLT